MTVNRFNIKDKSSLESRELVRLFHLLGPAYMRWTANSIPEHGLSPARMKLLTLLDGTGPAPMRALKDAVGSSATNITKLVDGLEQEGFVERDNSSKDRRLTLIRITAEGKSAIGGAWERYENSAAQVFERMPPLARQNLKEGVEALIAALKG